MFADSRNLGIVGDGGAAVSSSDSVLSAQTGFESYFFQDLTEQMGMITEEWKKSGAQFDGIVTGFMSDHRQIGGSESLLDLFHKEGTFFL